MLSRMTLALDVRSLPWLLNSGRRDELVEVCTVPSSQVNAFSRRRTQPAPESVQRDERPSQQFHLRSGRDRSISGSILCSTVQIRRGHLGEVGVFD